jgi:hypothetical protein
MATKYDFDLIKGETFSQRVVIRDDNYNYKNLSGYLISGHAKYNYCNSGYLLNLNPSIYSYESGTIDLSIPFTGTLSLPVTKAPYDINLYLNDVSENVLYGYVYIYPGIIGTRY